MNLCNDNCILLQVLLLAILVEDWQLFFEKVAVAVMKEGSTNSKIGDFARFDISSILSQNHLFQCYLLIPVHLL